MKKFFPYMILYCCLIFASIRGMHSLSNTNIARPGVPTLRELIVKFLAENESFSYLSRPTCLDLHQKNDVFANIPDDLMPEVTLINKKNISLDHLGVQRDIVNLAENVDTHQVVMTAEDGSLITVDMLTNKVDKVLISAKEHDTYGGNYICLEEDMCIAHTPDEADLIYDRVWLSDEEATVEDWDNQNEGFLPYVNTALSRDGHFWAATSNQLSNTLQLGKVADMFGLGTSGQAQPYKKMIIQNGPDVMYSDIGTLALGSDGSQCAITHWQGFTMVFKGKRRLRFWDAQGTELQTFDIPNPNFLVYAHNEPWLAACHEKEMFSLWDVKTAKQFAGIKLFSEEELTTAMEISHDDTTIYVGTVLGNICAYNKESKQNTQRLAHDDTVRIIKSHPQDLCVITAADDGKVKLWNKDFTQPLAILKYDATALNFSQDGTFLYIVTRDKKLHRIPLGTPQEVLCVRLYHYCKSDKDQLSALKNSEMYQRIMSNIDPKSIFRNHILQYLKQAVGQ